MKPLNDERLLTGVIGGTGQDFLALVATNQAPGSVHEMFVVDNRLKAEHKVLLPYFVELLDSEAERVRSNPASYPELAELLPLEQYLPISPTDGTPQIAAYGRLLLLANMQGVLNRIIAALASLSRGGQSGKLQVRIVHSCAGGTGTGSAVEFPFLIRHAFSELKGEPSDILIRQFIIRSDGIRQQVKEPINRDKMKANEFSFLTLYSDSCRRPSESCKYSPHPDRHIQVGGYPADITYLIDIANRVGSGGGQILSYADQVELVYRICSLDFTHPEVAGKQEQIIGTFIDQLRAKVKGQPAPFCGISCCFLRFPVEEVVKYTSLAASKRLLEAVIGSGEKRPGAITYRYPSLAEIRSLNKAWLQRAERAMAELKGFGKTKADVEAAKLKTQDILRSTEEGFENLQSHVNAERKRWVEEQKKTVIDTIGGLSCSQAKAMVQNGLQQLKNQKKSLETECFGSTAKMEGSQKTFQAAATEFSRNPGRGGRIRNFRVSSEVVFATEIAVVEALKQIIPEKNGAIITQARLDAVLEIYTFLESLLNRLDIVQQKLQAASTECDRRIDVARDELLLPKSKFVVNWIDEGELASLIKARVTDSALVNFYDLFRNRHSHVLDLEKISTDSLLDEVTNLASEQLCMPLREITIEKRLLEFPKVIEAATFIAKKVEMFAPYLVYKPELLGQYEPIRTTVIGCRLESKSLVSELTTALSGRVRGGVGFVTNDDPYEMVILNGIYRIPAFALGLDTFRDAAERRLAQGELVFGLRDFEDLWPVDSVSTNGRAALMASLGLIAGQLIRRGTWVVKSDGTPLCQGVEDLPRAIESEEAAIKRIWDSWFETEGIQGICHRLDVGRKNGLLWRELRQVVDDVYRRLSTEDRNLSRDRVRAVLYGEVS